jgi:sulfite reductase beta subunit-like hemoprotein
VAVARRLGTTVFASLPAPLRTRLEPGRLEQPDGRVAVTAQVPLGRLDGSDLPRLAAIAPEVRIGSGRTVTVLDVAPGACRDLEAGLRRLGLVLEPGSGWVGLTACSGRGRCPRARLDWDAAIRERAASRSARAPAEHWTACDRRCGERANQPVSVSAAEGEIEVRVDGTVHCAGTVARAVAVLAG